MKLTFPFKNYALKSLLDFFKPSYINSFATSDQTYEEFLEKDFDANDFKERIPSFENELLQVINTTNQETIDYYFQDLESDMNYLQQLYDEKHLQEDVINWNNERIGEFENQIEEKTEEYFKSEDRKKAHLEEYEGVDFGSYLMTREFKNVKKINYNFCCAEQKLSYTDLSYIDPYRKLLLHQLRLFGTVAFKYLEMWQKGEIKEKGAAKIVLKPILFCEGDIDIDLIRKATELLNRNDLLDNLDLRQRGSCNNLDKLWKILTEDNWETLLQKKVLLYDCDTNRPNQDFGHLYRRTITEIKENPIRRGIENLFSKETIARAREAKPAFFDIVNRSGTERGVPFESTEISINKQEKRNFCNWLLENGTEEDFAQFKIIFEIVEKVL
jgi:hypothetical protein